MMKLLRQLSLFAFCSSAFFATFALAQLTTLPCEGTFTVNRDFFHIAFVAYCEQGFTHPGGLDFFPPLPKETFFDCAIACVEHGPACGSFTYDRSLDVTENNCQLIHATNLILHYIGPPLNPRYDSALVKNETHPNTTRDCDTVSRDQNYRGFDLLCGLGIDSQANTSGNNNGNNNNNNNGNADDRSILLDTVFSSSIADCIDRCTDYKSGTGTLLCQAVTFDSTMIHGYENCYILGQGYAGPSAMDGGWDSARLTNTTAVNVTSTISNGGGTTTSRSQLSRVSVNHASSSAISDSYGGTTSKLPTPAVSPSATPSPSSLSSDSYHGLSAQAKGGIAGGLCALVILAVALFLFGLRRARNRGAIAQPADKTTQGPGRRHLEMGASEIRHPTSHSATTGIIRGRGRELGANEVAAAELQSEGSRRPPPPATSRPTETRTSRVRHLWTLPE